MDLHSRSQMYEKSKTWVFTFSEILRSIWIKFRMLLQPVGLLKLLLNLFCRVIFKGEKSAVVTVYNIRLTLSCVGTQVNRFVSNLV